jgi:hypothetical protein
VKIVLLRSHSCIKHKRQGNAILGTYVVGVGEIVVVVVGLVVIVGMLEVSALSQGQYLSISRSGSRTL